MLGKLLHIQFPINDGKEKAERLRRSALLLISLLPIHLSYNKTQLF